MGHVGTGTKAAGAASAKATRGAETVEARVKALEKRLDKLLSGKIELEVKDVKGLTVAPRSKLRVSCE
jgi:hypothetical protein